MRVALNKQKLLEKLDRVKYEKDEEGQEDQLGQMNLSGVLLALARIDHQNEYSTCYRITEHLLGSVPEPQDLEISTDWDEE